MLNLKEKHGYATRTTAGEVTRIAPSPTGRPHIGTAMQAIINKAVAQKSDGVFVLRIDDTDRNRLVEGVIEDIIASVKWLGISFDEGCQIGGDFGPYMQSERLNLYQEAADYLVEEGKAFHCFCTAEQLEADRNEMMKNGQDLQYNGRCKHLSAEEVAAKKAAGEKSVIRMDIPKEEEITFTDGVRGEITIHGSQVDMSVILKSDGFPTYHLATVVDDHLMGITTIIRGEEWISSTPKHKLLFDYLGWDMPKLIHTPLLRDTEKRKLSKRSGDTSIDWFISQGYLAEGFKNFISRICWAHPEEKDIYSFDEFSQLLDGKDLPKTGPVVDFSLLSFINAQYMQDMTAQERYDAALPYFKRIAELEAPVVIKDYNGKKVSEYEFTPAEAAKMLENMRNDQEMSLALLDLEPGRFRKLSDIYEQGRTYFANMYQCPTLAEIEKTEKGTVFAETFLNDFLAWYQADVDHDTWQDWLSAQAEKHGVKAGPVFMLTRLAITSALKTPPLFEYTQIIGEDELRRRVGLVQDMLSAQRAATA